MDQQTVNEKQRKEFRDLIVILCCGFLLWLNGIIWLLVLAGESPNLFTFLFVPLVLFAGPLTVGCILLAYKYRRAAQMVAAIETLQLPFKYAALIVGVALLVGFVESLQ